MQFGSRFSHTLSRFTLNRILLLGLLAALAAGCSGGGGSSPDTTPDAFSFTAATNQEPNAVATASAVTITGIDNGTALSISGGSYSLDNGSTFVTAATTINANQSVIVRGTASNEFATTTQVALTVGTSTQSFSITTRARDITPDGLAQFTPVTDGNLSTAYTSNAITVNGVEGAVAVSITNGTYDINGSDTFTAAAGTVSNGQTLRVRATSAATFDTPVTATLTVGSATRSFTVTALADTTPNALGFATTSANLNPGQVVESAVLTITGVNTSTPISITNGEYQIVGGSAGYVSTAGTVTNEAQIQVRGTASAVQAGVVNVSLSVGAVTEVWQLQTVADTTPPSVNIAFPPRASMTEGAVVTVRGTASDDLSSITALTVNGVAVTDTSDDGSYATWRVSVPLSEGDNTLTVSVQDSADNNSVNAAAVSVKRDAAKGNFPNGDVPFSRPQAIAVDYARNRALVGDRDSATLIAVDLNTGVRTAFSDTTSTGMDFPNVIVEGLLFDAEMDRLWMTDSFENIVFEVDADSGVRQILSSNSQPVGEVELNSPAEISFHPLDNSQVFVYDSAAMVAVSLIDGERSLFSTGSQNNRTPTPDNEDRFGYPRGGVFDEIGRRMVVVDENGPMRLMSVSIGSDVLPDGKRLIFSDNTTPNADEPIFSLIRTIVLDQARNRVLVNDIGNFEGPEFEVGILSVVFHNDGEAVAGTRGYFSTRTKPDAINSPDAPEEIFYDGILGYVLLIDSGLDALLAIDIDSGERVFLSKASAL